MCKTRSDLTPTPPHPEKGGFSQVMGLCQNVIGKTRPYTSAPLHLRTSVPLYPEKGGFSQVSGWCQNVIGKTRPYTPICVIL
ncbi:MAG: hypothetical protein RID53_18085 [Coleofasciculus sp. B1-GNL1-01]|uniref:hypothetical protein n=1 Tax=Coleofasciculus sp. B1-GNL1-01 TaxID=3068484 RepID=UPI0032F7CFE1